MWGCSLYKGTRIQQVMYHNYSNTSYPLIHPKPQHDNNNFLITSDTQSCLGRLIRKGWVCCCHVICLISHMQPLPIVSSKGRAQGVKSLVKHNKLSRCWANWLLRRIRSDKKLTSVLPAQKRVSPIFKK